MAATDLKVETAGFEQLLAKLKQFSEKDRDRLMANALRAGSRIAALGIAPKAPRRALVSKNRPRVRRIAGPKKGASLGVRSPGYLRRNIINRRDRKARDRIVYNVGPRREAFYGRYTELGTPRIRDTDWMTRGWRSSSRNTQRRIATNLRNGISRTLRKRGKPKRDRRL